MRVFCFLVLFTAFSSFVLGQDRLTGEAFTTRSEVLATGGMAATSQPLATQAALEILRKGGSAVDAAIAANAVLGVVEPTGCGIGGDLFAIVWDNDKKELTGLNGSGRSPYEINREIFEKEGMESIPPFGPLPVTVPGCVDAWFSLHMRYGKLPMPELLEPAIRYAQGGFPVSEVIAYYMGRNARVLSDFPGFRETFMPSGTTPAEGDIFTNPKLARTLAVIGEGGREAFYRGEIAETIVNTVRKAGGYLSMKDMADHRSEWVDPVSTDYRGYTVWELPPNGQGIAALQMLNILESYDISSMGFGSAEYIHLLIEAKKLAFEDRARYYADPDFSDIPVGELISKPYAEKRRLLIDMEKAGKTYPGGLEDANNTIYLTVADQWGNMVSLIQSNYRGMGSGIIPEGTGFVLQDRGELFSLDPDHPNTLEPHKRPFHTIIPAFVTKNGEPWLSFGVMGGSMQPQGHVQVLVNMIDFGMDLQEAGDAPRIRHSGSSQPTGGVMRDGGRVNAEVGIPYETIRELMKKGHNIGYSLGGYGGFQGILKSRNGVYHGASESRKDGQAAGF